MHYFQEGLWHHLIGLLCNRLAIRFVGRRTRKGERVQKRVRMFSNWKESDGERYSGGRVDEFVCASEKKNVHLSGCICACL